MGLAHRHATGYNVCIGRDPEPPHHRPTAMTIDTAIQVLIANGFSVSIGRDWIGCVHFVRKDGRLIQAFGSVDLIRCLPRILNGDIS